MLTLEKLLDLKQAIFKREREIPLLTINSVEDFADALLEIKSPKARLSDIYEGNLYYMAEIILESGQALQLQHLKPTELHSLAIARKPCNLTINFKANLPDKNSIYYSYDLKVQGRLLIGKKRLITKEDLTEKGFRGYLHDGSTAIFTLIE